MRSGCSRPRWQRNGVGQGDGGRGGIVARRREPDYGFEAGRRDFGEERGRERWRTCASLRAAAQTLNRWGAICSRRFRNLAVAKLPAGDADSPLDDIPDHEVTELKRLAAGASSRDIMRLFRLMADSQEQILRSPYPDLLLEMAVVRMASLAAVIDADELLRAIGADKTAAPPSSGTPPAPSGGGSGSRGAAKPERRIEGTIERRAAAARRGRSQGRCAASP